MAANNMSDTERAEEVRKQIIRFLPATLVGLAIGFGGYHSWSYFEEANTRYSIEASADFTLFVEGEWIDGDYTEIEPERLKTIIAKGEALLEEFPQHFYADLCRFIMARLLVAAQDYDGAIRHLLQIEKVNNDAYTTASAQFRIAQLYQLKSEDDKALEFLDKIRSEKIKPVADDLRGDIHLRAYDYEKAWKSWMDARSATDQDSFERYLDVKIDFIESIPPDIAEEIVREGLAAQAEAKEEARLKAEAKAKAAAEAEAKAKAAAEDEAKAAAEDEAKAAAEDEAKAAAEDEAKAAAEDEAKAAAEEEAKAAAEAEAKAAAEAEAKAAAEAEAKAAAEAEAKAAAEAEAKAAAQAELEQAEADGGEEGDEAPVDDGAGEDAGLADKVPEASGN